MRSKNPYRKFETEQSKIETLEKTNPRFRRVYSEYALMSEELWELENSSGDNLPDDFLNSIRIQQNYLEEEVEDWLNADQWEPQ